MLSHRFYYQQQFFYLTRTKRALPWKTPPPEPRVEPWWPGVKRKGIDQRKGLYYGQ